MTDRRVRRIQIEILERDGSVTKTVGGPGSGTFSVSRRHLDSIENELWERMRRESPFGDLHETKEG